MYNQSKYHGHSDADSRIQDIMTLEQITISENPPTPCHKSMTVDAGDADLCLEEGVGEKMYPPRGKVDEDEKSTTSSDNALPFPPVLRRDVNGSLILIKDEKGKEEDTCDEYVYDSDDTCDEYVECHENGLCKCRKMREGEYYEYFMQTMVKHTHTMYPQGKCILPKGAVLHFTGAPKGMKREDVKEALVALDAKVEFVDYQFGNTEGWARLSYPYEARIIIKRMTDKKLNIADADLSFRVLSNKDEKRYLKKVVEAIQQLEKKAKGLDRKLKKAGYTYVKHFNPNNDW